MFRDIFLNFTILVSSIFLISQLYIYMSKFKFNKLTVKISFGIAGGLVAILLMNNAVRVSEQIIFDFRHLTILVVATFGGFSASLITGIIIFTYRLFYLGITMDSIVVSTNMLIVAIGCGLITKLNIKRTIKWIYMNIISFIMISISFYTRVPNRESALNTIVIFWISSIIVGSIVYNITSYIILSEKLFRKFKYQSEYDFLTGLRNARTFNSVIENIEDAEDIIEKEYKKISVLFIDIDFFKKINDTYGHDCGDKVLKESAKIFVEIFENSEMIFRVGGEEFITILRDCGNKKAIEIAEKVRYAYEKHKFIINNSLRLQATISIGVATFPETIDNIKSLVRQADKALYKAKENGRNRVEKIK